MSKRMRKSKAKGKSTKESKASITKEEACKTSSHPEMKGRHETKASNTRFDIQFNGRTYHKVRVDNTHYTIDKRYKPKANLGHGAYGQVVSALDTKTGRKVAIKRVDRLLDDETDAKRILREIKILRHLRHANIVKLVDFFLEPKQEFNVVYIVFELMQTDLRKVIRSKNVLQKAHVQWITYQLLCGLKYMHSANVWHRDLKPANILLNSNSALKICDFGLSRGVEENPCTVTDYVVTRWYRAPEVMVCDKYDEKIDVWAVGCILAEMYGRKPAFRGSDSRDQVSEYLKVLGRPTEDDVSFITNDNARRFVVNFGKKLPYGNKLGEKYKNMDKDAMDLLVKMLQFNPKNRVSIEECLSHPFYKEARRSRYEKLSQSKFDFSFEDRLNGRADLIKEFRAEAENWTPVLA
eukprot:CAMPEP_0170168930 /NCGR_PEP_ID=MMETSP0040_2-20121228/1887_1 /TAXON_ID=641309 /ORGANISM="Lotharella oceanica, Strain CCMP622" /LENGTH=407 /DNA_ID=CAMNT_0010407387 /DNA_START=71 /DNA_END=1294 /DNA_ORIENTATION=-